MLLRSRRAQLVPCFGSVEFLTCLWIACGILTLVASEDDFYIDGRYGKRGEPHAESVFASNNRHGRSDISQRNAYFMQKLKELLPWSYEFHAGSRYGKRSAPVDSRSVSSLNRFNDAVLDYVDRFDVDRINDMNTGEDDLRVFS